MDQKTLYLARHAKSDWDSPSSSDFDRCLNQRGLQDAAMMGKRLAKSNISPELIISSSAIRAKITAQLIASEIGYEGSHIKLVDDIYEAYVDDLERVIHGIDNELNHVMLVGHNPGMTELVNWLTGSHISNIPTGGIATLQASSGNWKGFIKGHVKLVEYDYPKN